MDELVGFLFGLTLIFGTPSTFAGWLVIYCAAFFVFIVSFMIITFPMWMWIAKHLK